jgi:hypothetical protein
MDICNAAEIPKNYFANEIFGENHTLYDLLSSAYLTKRQTDSAREKSDEVFELCINGRTGSWH